MISDKAIISIVLDFIQNSTDELIDSLIGFVKFNTSDKSIVKMDVFTIIYGGPDADSLQIHIKSSIKKGFNMECVISGCTYPLFEIPINENVISKLMDRINNLIVDGINTHMNPIRTIQNDVLPFDYPKTLKFVINNGVVL